MNNLDLANVISVSVLPTPLGLGVPNINTAALVSKEAKPGTWGGSQTYAVYKNVDDVATDWGSGSDAAAIAAAFFQQNPNCLLTGGYLVVIPRLTTPTLETIEAAVARLKDSIYFFGVLVDEELHADEAGFISLTAYIQTQDKILGYASSYTADFDPGGMLDDVRTALKVNTRCLYHKTATALDTQLFAASYMGRALSTDFGASLTSETMHLKQLVGVSPDETITQTILNAALAAGVDTYPSIAGVPGVFCAGLNAFFDQVYSRFWLKFALQSAGFNYLAMSSGKIPQTEKGMDGLKDAYRQVLVQAVANGYSAPGAWNSSTTFGDPVALRRNVADIGYYVYSTPVAQQSSSDRNLRKAPLVQIALKEAGAVHSSAIVVEVNQ